MCDEYLAWGRKQGGKNRKPWSEKHARNRSAQLRWWQKQLEFEFLGDLATGDLLARAEIELRAMSDVRTGRTVMNYAEALAAFCDWCLQRGYLESDPLKNLVGFDTTPTRIRRAMSAEEIAQLLDVCTVERRLVYEAAFLSGLRAGELRSLTIDDLDTERCGLRLKAAWTKNRRAGFQFLPRDLVDRLFSFAGSGTPRELYEETYRRNHKGDISKIPGQPLLYVPSHPGRSLYQDLKRAGIPKQTAKGVVDFHAARTAYINLVFEDAELTLKDAQELARHSSADLTLEVYGRARDDRMVAAVERMAKRVIPQEKRVKYVSNQVVGAETEIATSYRTEGCDSIDMAPAVGLEPTASESTSAAQSRTTAAEPAHLLDLSDARNCFEQQNSAEPKQPQGTSSQKKRGICVGKNSAVEKVVEVWDRLPPEVQTKILKLIDESSGRAQRATS